MELLLDEKVGHVYLNDSSVHIYAFWKAVLSEPETFCRRISRASLTLETWRSHREIVRHPGDHDLNALGFSTFYLNRCNRSGILTAGVIGGVAQRGKWRIDARFPRNELIRRIEVIAAKASHITITNLDAERFITRRVNALAPETLVYCDPPYYARAAHLYLSTYLPEDHTRLAQVIQKKLQRPWMVSYDAHPAIISLYRGRGRFRYSLQYSAIKKYAGSEVFVFSDSLIIPRTSALPYIANSLSSLRRSA
jgi:DNA adenine methylase